MIDKKYSTFFDEIRVFKEKQDQQKRRGLNDYNLLTTVLGQNDEVRLHSRVIGSLLDVDGLHYQGSLFLEKFLNVLNLGFFDFEIENSSLSLEYKNIDIYLTDGKKHIIIENKLQAGDQKHQIPKYINTIKDENYGLHPDDILVIYLSVDRTSPSRYSLNNLVIDNSGGYLLLDEDKVSIFKNINYKYEILNWLQLCLYEIQNVTNLNESIKQYQSVVQKVTNKYQGKVMSLKDFLFESDNMIIAREIEDSYLHAKAEVQYEFWIALQGSLRQRGLVFDFVDSKYNPIDIKSRTKDYYEKTRNVKFFGLKQELKSIDEKNTLKVSFYIELDCNILIGFTVSQDDERKDIAKKTEFSEISDKIISNGAINWRYTNQKSETWWICWKFPIDRIDFYSFNSKIVFNLIDQDKRTKIVDDLADEIKGLIDGAGLEI